MTISDPLVDYLGYTATFFTILQFISGVTVCLTISKLKSTGDRSSITFISGALMCYVWYRYGLAVNDPNIYFVNILGCVIHVGYSLLFSYYSPVSKRRPIKIQCVASLFIVFCLHGMQKMGTSHEDSLHYTGLLGSVLSVAFAASPLVSLKYVFKNKSTDVLPYYIIVSVFVVASLWFLYGLCKGDPFIIFTNGTNALVSLFQLSLFVIYPSSQTKKESLLKESII